jgi:gliding motility-associated-like protein
MRSRVSYILYRNIYLLLTLSLLVRFDSAKVFEIESYPITRTNFLSSADHLGYLSQILDLRPVRKLSLQNNLATNDLPPAFGPPYIVPVVFHIISSNPYAVTDQTILNAVQDLNDAFAHTGIYASGPPGANTQITFCLAKIDPNGGNTTGITRTQSVLGNFDGDIENDAMKNLVSWDTRTYCNIWLVDTVHNEYFTSFSCGRWIRNFNTGYATFSPGGDFRDGIVTTGFGPPTLATLMGTYLGLKYTFILGDCTNNDCNSDGDGICDTPPSSVAGGSCTNPQNSCSTDTLSGFTMDVPDLTSNFMSLSGSCANEFTSGQAIKMQSNLTTVRSSLIVQNKCNPSCSENIIASFTRDNWSPKPGDQINFTSTSTGGTNYQWSVDGVNVGSNFASYSQVFSTLGKFEVTLKVYNGNSGCYATYSDNIIVTCGVMARFSPNVRQIASKENILLDSILFTNRSVNATAYQWWMSNNTGMSPQIVSTQYNLNYTFNTPGQYSIWLVAMNGSCSDTTEKFDFPVYDPTVDGTMGFDAAECYKTDSIRMTITVCNYGYASVPVGTPVSFYDDDPGKATANKLSPTFFLPYPVTGHCCNNYTFIISTNKPRLNQLYGVFNDSGTTKPLKLPNTLLPETNYANNIGTISKFQFQVVAAPPSAVLQPGDTLQLSAQAGPDSAAYIVWATAQNMSCADCANPYYIAEHEVDTITKKVIATNAYGCVDSSFVIIKIPPFDDFVIKIDSVNCAGEDSMVVNFTLCDNFKRGNIPKGLNVALYDANPSLVSSNLLGPIFSTSTPSQGLCEAYVQSFKRTGTNIVYAIVNNKDTTNSLHIPGDSLFLESDYSNNTDSLPYKPVSVILSPSDTTIFNKQSIVISIISPIYDVSSTNWLPGAGYSLSCTSCLSPTVTVTNNALVQMQTANRYGCMIKGIDTINIFPPDMTIEIIGTNCFTNNTTSVKFRICMNNDYDSIYANLPVSFYDGNPLAGNPKLLVPTFYTQNSIPLSCDSFTQVVSTPGSGKLYAVVNDKGKNINNIPDKAFDETDYLNDTAGHTIIPFETFIAPSDTTIMRFSSVQIIASVTGGQITSYSWEPAEFLSCANCLTPVATPPYSIKYELIAQNEFSCIDTASAEIKTFAGGKVDIPNAFTPNGDGRNDIFYILGSSDIKMIKEFAIYDRYGGKIFAVSNVPPNDPAYGWNGNINGRHAEMGAYVYYAIILFNDGSQQEYKGTVVLIR